MIGGRVRRGLQDRDGSRGRRPTLHEPVEVVSRRPGDGAVPGSLPARSERAVDERRVGAGTREGGERRTHRVHARGALAADDAVDVDLGDRRLRIHAHPEGDDRPCRRGLEACLQGRRPRCARPRAGNGDEPAAAVRPGRLDVVRAHRRDGIEVQDAAAAGERHLEGRGRYELLPDPPELAPQRRQVGAAERGEAGREGLCRIGARHAQRGEQGRLGGLVDDVAGCARHRRPGQRRAAHARRIAERRPLGRFGHDGRRRWAGVVHLDGERLPEGADAGPGLYPLVQVALSPGPDVDDPTRTPREVQRHHAAEPVEARLRLARVSILGGSPAAGRDESGVERHDVETPQGRLGVAAELEPRGEQGGDRVVLIGCCKLGELGAAVRPVPSEVDGQRSRRLQSDGEDRGCVGRLCGLGVRRGCPRAPAPEDVLCRHGVHVIGCARVAHDLGPDRGRSGAVVGEQHGAGTRRLACREGMVALDVGGPARDQDLAPVAAGSPDHVADRAGGVITRVGEHRIEGSAPGDAHGVDRRTVHRLRAAVADERGCDRCGRFE